ncbi:hypothetical protein CPB84DRAFT_1752622 [Gymnopilus junonius]|uniref:Uncharacterized protein n=1 Tax=Gymnopilus junonius TaxID=109634 RepID=A0A9P5NCG3_GYMJU|nr:hypothetical protein CPB84DRAFT_1752622 [Gymnopilus junonius]
MSIKKFKKNKLSWDCFWAILFDSWTGMIYLLGLAAGIGMDIDILQIICILAADLYQNDNGDQNLPVFTRSLKIYIDGGAGVDKLIPGKYHKDWWWQKHMPFSDDLVGPTSIMKCLEIHQEEETCLQKQKTLSEENERIMHELNVSCNNCINNWNLTVKANTKDENHIRYFKSVQDTFAQNWDSAACCAVGFFKLYEPAVQKEMQEMTEQPGISVSNVIEGSSQKTCGGLECNQVKIAVKQVQANVAAELELLKQMQDQLRTMPQWTGPGPNQLLHSGYHIMQDDSGQTGYLPGDTPLSSNAENEDGDNDEDSPDPGNPPVHSPTGCPDVLMGSNGEGDDEFAGPGDIFTGQDGDGHFEGDGSMDEEGFAGPWDIFVNMQGIAAGLSDVHHADDSDGEFAAPGDVISSRENENSPFNGDESESTDEGEFAGPGNIFIDMESIAEEEATALNPWRP